MQRISIEDGLLSMCCAISATLCNFSLWSLGLDIKYILTEMNAIRYMCDFDPKIFVLFSVDI